MLSDPRRVSHFFTVDVEEYFQVKALEASVPRSSWLDRPSRVGDSVDKLLELLGQRGVFGTFFVLGWLAREHPEVVRRIAAEGHEIASHGFWHNPVYSQDSASFREDLRASKQELEDVVGSEVRGYRAPNFSITRGTEWAFDVLIEEGFYYDSSIFPIRRRGYGYAGASRAVHVVHRESGKLAEFPLATTSFLRWNIPAAGGGYLRQLPFSLIRRAFREASGRGEPTTFYIHPWEIDADQPRIPVSRLTSIRHYRGLEAAFGGIDALLKEFSFVPIRSFLSRALALGNAVEYAGVA